MRLTEDNYVDMAERAIKKLSGEKKQKRKTNPVGNNFEN